MTDNTILVVVIDPPNASDLIPGLEGIGIPPNSHYRIQRISGLEYLDAVNVAGQLAQRERASHLFIVNNTHSHDDRSLGDGVALAGRTGECGQSVLADGR